MIVIQFLLVIALGAILGYDIGNQVVHGLTVEGFVLAGALLGAMLGTCTMMIINSRSEK